MRRRTAAIVRVALFGRGGVLRRMEWNMVRGTFFSLALAGGLFGTTAWAESPPTAEPGPPPPAEKAPPPPAEPASPPGTVTTETTVTETTVTVDVPVEKVDEILKAQQGATDMGVETNIFGEEVVSEDAATLPEEPEEISDVRYFLGARWRSLIVPKFILNWFGDGGKNLFFPIAPGLEFNIHTPKMEYDFSIWYVGYGFDDMLFKGNNEPEKAWEYINSTMGTVYATVDFLWLADLAPNLNLTYGFSLGLGYVFGNLVRTQAYPPYPGAPVEDWLPCQGPGDPNADFCQSGDDEHYNYEEPDWFNGGGKPVVYPWIAVQTGIRYQFEDLALRFDGGFGSSGFLLGVAVDVALSPAPPAPTH